MRFLTTVSFFSMMIFKSLFTMPSTIQIELLNNQFGSLARILHQLKICSRNVTKIVSSLPMRHTKTLAYNYYDPAVQRAILDNYLLSRSNLLITTAWSSFGEMAVGRMDSGSTILITRSDPIKDPPPLVTINHTSLSWNCLLKICIYEIFWIFRCPPKHLLI